MKKTAELQAKDQVRKAGASELGNVIDAMTGAGGFDTEHRTVIKNKLIDGVLSGTISTDISIPYNKDVPDTTELETFINKKLDIK